MVEKIAAGNWKMNGTVADLAELSKMANAADRCMVETVIGLPATLLVPAATDLSNQSDLRLAAQDCHANASGAHTGDLAADMLADAGAEYVILGHSERRMDHGETDAQVAAKVTAARASDLTPIVCIGETLEQREAGDALKVAISQMTNSIPDGTTAGLVVAYEPVWAIGTGKTATPDLIAEVHNALRAALIERFGDDGADIPLLYGGSVKAANAAEIFAVEHVNGALVGGASLTAEAFVPIIESLAAS
ncbi:MAG: triose-phosphate isomerase [Planktomarina sp.]